LRGTRNQVDDAVSGVNNESEREIRRRQSLERDGWRVASSFDR
jgi:hypothetical protein